MFLYINSLEVECGDYTEGCYAGELSNVEVSSRGDASKRKA